MKRKTYAILSAQLILVAASLFVLIGAPLAEDLMKNLPKQWEIYA